MENIFKSETNQKIFVWEKHNCGRIEALISEKYLSKCTIKDSIGQSIQYKNIELNDIEFLKFLRDSISELLEEIKK
jgi:hypothetical protein